MGPPCPEAPFRRIRGLKPPRAGAAAGRPIHLCYACGRPADVFCKACFWVYCFACRLGHRCPEIEQILAASSPPPSASAAAPDAAADSDDDDMPGLVADSDLSSGDESNARQTAVRGARGVRWKPMDVGRHRRCTRHHVRHAKRGG